jgi:hypothetical protein
MMAVLSAVGYLACISRSIQLQSAYVLTESKLLPAVALISSTQPDRISNRVSSEILLVTAGDELLVVSFFAVAASWLLQDTKTAQQRRRKSLFMIDCF